MNKTVCVPLIENQCYAVKVQLVEHSTIKLKRPTLPAITLCVGVVNPAEFGPFPSHLHGRKVCQLTWTWNTCMCVYVCRFFNSEYILTGLWDIQKCFCLSKNSMLSLWNHHNNSLSNSPLLFQVYMNDWSVHSNLLFGARIQIGGVTWFPLTPMVAAWCQRPCPKWHPKPLRSSSESALSWCNAALAVG